VSQDIGDNRSSLEHVVEVVVEAVVEVLGARTPTDALVATVRAVDVVTAQRAVTRRSAVGSIEAAHALPGVQAFYAGDAFAAPATRKDVAGIYLGDDFVDAAVIIEESTSMRRRPRVQEVAPS